MVIAIETMDNLNKELEAAGDKLVVIDFYATWCGPCKMIGPVIDGWAKEMTDVVFLKVDVDEVTDVSTEYKITAMPTFILIKNKKKVDDLMGANADKLKELIMKHK